jgi:putative salt-induced outer membrane protein
MKLFATLSTATALALLMAPAVSAQTLIGDRVLDDRISDIEIETQRNLARSSDSVRYTFGSGERTSTGSVSMTYSGATGNTDTQDFAAGGRYTQRFGDWSHSLGFAFGFGEANNVKNEENAFAIYDVTRSFSDRFYVFGVARLEVDEFASNKKDAFVGFGPGYRLVNTDDVAWRVQAGVGARYTELQNGVDDTNAAGIVSSRLFYRISPIIALTNDTDILSSDNNTLVTNDFGVNIAMSKTLSTRLGYRTEYDTDPLPGLKSTDNTLNVSLVYSFN